MKLWAIPFENYMATILKGLLAVYITDKGNSH